MPTALALASILAFVPRPAVPQQPDLARLDRCVQEHLQKDRIPGASIAIVHRGKEVLAKGYGVASLELQTPVTADTVFAIASVTKTFTATIVLQLVEKHALELDRPIGELLHDLPANGLPANWRAVTVRQLLSHTSGLPDVIVDPVLGKWLADARDDAVAAAGKLPLQFAPGASWSYNQTNYLLLGMIVEQLCSKPFDDVVQERIVAPLQLRSTTFGDAKVVVPRRATWYTAIDWDGKQPKRSAELHPAFVTYPQWIHTAAALNTTARELAAFAEAVARGKLLAEATRKTMWSSVALADGTPFRFEGTLGMGLGWMVDERPGHRAAGGSGGSSVAFRHFVDDELTVVVLTNLQGHDPDGFVQELAALCVPALAPGR
jgi:CubicO group peptidase (beta-lactamase class C family)